MKSGNINNDYDAFENQSQPSIAPASPPEVQYCRLHRRRHHLYHDVKKMMMKKKKLHLPNQLDEPCQWLQAIIWTTLLELELPNPTNRRILPLEVNPRQQ